jgi:hypothetical protein
MDYYELYVRERGIGDTAPGLSSGSDEYIYQTSAREGQVLRVAVQPDYWYDFLLLAGNYEWRTLLASSYYQPTKITSGQVHTVDFTLVFIGSDPTDSVDGYVFEDSGASTVGSAPAAGTVPPYVDIVMATLPKKSSLSAPGNDLNISIKTNGLSPLVAANDPVAATETGVPTFEASKLFLKQEGTIHYIAALTATGGTLTGDYGDITIEYPFSINTWPDVDAYGRLYYNITYRAFGRTGVSDNSRQPTYEPPLWNIRNGFNPLTLDKGAGTDGGGLLVIIGDDPGDFANQGTIEYTPGQN